MVAKPSMEYVVQKTHKFYFKIWLKIEELKEWFDSNEKIHQILICNDKGHSFITSAIWLVGWIQKMGFFAEVQFCIDAEIMGGWSEKSKNMLT